MEGGATPKAWGLGWGGPGVSSPESLSSSAPALKEEARGRAPGCPRR